MPSMKWWMTMMCIASLACGAAAGEKPRGRADEPIDIVVGKDVLNEVDGRVFGQFMERASWGEPGYDAARDPDNPRQLAPAVVEKIRQLHIPVIRFPAGSDLPRIDWRDMIDNVPGREGGRPTFKAKKGELTNEFGLDEFFALCEEIGAEPLLPVRLRPALGKRVPLKEAAAEAAALVAYCNAPLDANLPEGLAAWPKVRATNGRRKPWGVKYVQIGNESWQYYRHAIKEAGLADAGDNEQIAWYRQCLLAYAEAIRAVDGDAKIIIDGVISGSRWLDWQVITDPQVRKLTDYVSLHMYLPWGVKEIQRDGQAVDASKLSPRELWYLLTCTPAVNRQTGQVRLPHWPDWWAVFDKDLPIAVTEWNWNGWWSMGADARPASLPQLAQGVGAAGMLHAFMRRGDQVRIGCQSMLVGTRWGITAVRVDDDGNRPPRILPTGLVTGFYSQYHGRRRLATEITNMVYYAQPLRANGIAPAERVAAVDALVTRDEDKLYLHLINRHFDGDLPVRVNLSAAGTPAGAATHRRIVGRLNNKPAEGEEHRAPAWVQSSPVPLDGTVLNVTLPKRSVSIIEVPLAGE